MKNKIKLFCLATFVAGITDNISAQTVFPFNIDSSNSYPVAATNPTPSKFTLNGSDIGIQDDRVSAQHSPTGDTFRNSLVPDPIKGPLKVSKNPNYFEDASGKALILCGSHSWNTLQDWGSNGSLQKLDFEAFVRFLKAHGHNFTLLWTTELPKFHNLPTTEPPSPDITVSPFPWKRVGPGLATDGGLKFDLDQFDQTYFDRLRTRVQALGNAGIYAGVYFFSAEWLLRFRCSTDGYPFSGNNNINGLDDGYKGGSPDTWVGSVTMTAPNAITRFQDAYVKKMIDVLNDLPNVLWIVS